MPERGFRDCFEPAARRVRGALFARKALDVATLGSVATFALLLGAHETGRAPTVALVAVPVAAAALSLLASARKRWSDTDVALYLDARVGQGESITTALEQVDKADDVAREVTGVATSLLSVAAGEKLRPRIVSQSHVGLPVFLGMCALVPLLPVRFPEGTRVEAPRDVVRGKLPGLEKVEALRDTETLSAEQKGRFDALARAAKALDAAAEKGLERKNALDSVARLRDALDRERGALFDSKNREGLEAAARALAKYPETTLASKALEAGDLALLDRETMRLADAAEKQSRDVARRAFDEATEAAAKHGASDAAHALDLERHLLDRHARQSAALERLAKLVAASAPPEQKRRLERLARDSASQEKLAEALADALEGLTPEERKKIAEAMASAANGAAPAETLSEADLKRLATALSNATNRDALRAELKGLAERGPSAATSARALAMAELGISSAERRLAGSGDREASPAGVPEGSENGQNGASGADPSGTSGKRAGRTDLVPGDPLVARVAMKTAGGVPFGSAPGTAPPAARAPLAATETALRIEGPREVGAVERSNVPKEYREQVSRYFAP